MFASNGDESIGGVGGAGMRLSERTSGTARLIRAGGAAVTIAAIAVLATGCAGTATKTGGSIAPMRAATKQASSAGTVTTASDVQTCGQCNKQGMPPRVAGTPAVENGVQVVSVGFVNGYYSPNRITVASGMPVRVVFTGKAKGCLAKPMFKSLDKKADVTTTGSATIDLGTLRPGTYTFTCAMGMNAGTITVR
jgi:plastocyanin